MRRRSAVHKINTLKEATREQLDNLDDICPICFQDFQELSTARITRCNHYFHELCLRKWLYVQDVCPLCHKTLYGSNENISTDELVSNNTTSTASVTTSNSTSSSTDVNYDPINSPTIIDHESTLNESSHLTGINQNEFHHL